MPNGLLYSVSWDTTTKTLSFTDKAGNLIYSCVVDTQPQPLVDDPTKPLYLLSKVDGSTVRLAQYNSPPDVFEVSTDGATWERATKNSDYTLDSGEGLYIRALGQRTTFYTSGSKMFRILMTGTIEAYHNVNSVLTPNFTSLTDLTTIGSSCLRGLFSRKLNDSAPDTALVKAPLLPATTLAPNCYHHMFYGCSSLAQCANVQATTLAMESCRGMYYDCVAITEAVLPPALVLASKTYANMFTGCTGLLSIHSFPFTSLDQDGVSNCGEMFRGCTSLTSAPELKPQTLVQGCYSNMFKNCYLLSSVTIAATDISAIDCLNLWLDGVAASGDFYCDSTTAFPTDSPSGIPQGWQRLPLS